MATSGNDSVPVPESYARIEKYRSLLGRNPDAEVADGIGVPVEDIKAYRRRYNIPAFLRPAPGVAPTTVAPRPASAPTAPTPEH